MLPRRLDPVRADLLEYPRRSLTSPESTDQFTSFRGFAEPPELGWGGDSGRETPYSAHWSVLWLLVGRDKPVHLSHSRLSL